MGNQGTKRRTLERNSGHAVPDCLLSQSAHDTRSASCYRVVRKQLVCTARPTQTVEYSLNRNKHLDGAETRNMILRDEAYNAALDIFEQAVAAFAAGDREQAEHLLASLDREAIERDRQQLLALARTARASTASPAAQRASKTISREIKESVQKRDGFRCRFTGRRLIDTRVFQEVARLSEVFHFDEHHAVYRTKRGSGGHPLVRTHGAAYEHAEPLSRGGQTTTDNIFLISVQLNESKGAKILERIEVPIDGWSGLAQYLPRLEMQRSIAKKPEPNSAGPVIVGAAPRSPRKASASARVREAATDLAVTVFALDHDAEAEAGFRQFRLLKKNAYFANEGKAGTWVIHRMNCSSLDFNIHVKLTASPKVCSERQEQLLEWARRFGAITTVCSRCRKSV